MKKTKLLKHVTTRGYMSNIQQGRRTRENNSNNKSNNNDKQINKMKKFNKKKR